MINKTKTSWLLRVKLKNLPRELMKNLSTLTKPRIDLIGLFILAIVQVTSVNLAKIALAMDTKK
ncbi:MAG: hypothetical protein IPO94_05440 [Saprospiraceae bacterium]|nr:hypothetical protein [Saprospiraceae bacterium]